MNQGHISKRYAKALCDYAAARNEDKALYERMKALTAASIAVPQLLPHLQNPMASQADKLALLTSAMGGGKLEESAKKFADLLLENGRENAAQGVAVCYTALYRRRHGISTVEITSSAPLPDKTVKKIRTDTEKMTGGTAEVATVVNENIGGGLIFLIDGLRFDGSVRGQLERIRRQFKRSNKIT